MATRCEYLKNGTQCGGYAVTGTKRCYLHTFNAARDETFRKAAEARAKKKLERKRQQLESAKPAVIAKAEHAGVDISDATFEDLPRFAAYISSLLLEGRITAPVGQALIAAGRLAVQAKEAEVDLMDLKLMQQRRIGR